MSETNGNGGGFTIELGKLRFSGRGAQAVTILMAVSLVVALGAAVVFQRDAQHRLVQAAEAGFVSLHGQLSEMARFFANEHAKRSAETAQTLDRLDCMTWIIANPADRDRLRRYLPPPKCLRPE